MTPSPRRSGRSARRPRPGQEVLARDRLDRRQRVAQPLLTGAVALGHPGLVPLADSADEPVGALRPPGAGRVRVDRPGLLQQRLDDPPGLLDGVFAGEELAVAADRVVEQPLVRLRVLARDLLEQHLEVGRIERLLAGPPGEEADSRAWFRLDPDHELVRLRAAPGAHAESRQPGEDDVAP